MFAVYDRPDDLQHSSFQAPSYIEVLIGTYQFSSGLGLGADSLSLFKSRLKSFLTRHMMKTNLEYIQLSCQTGAAATLLLFSVSTWTPFYLIFMCEHLSRSAVCEILRPACLAFLLDNLKASVRHLPSHCVDKTFWILFVWPPSQVDCSHQDPFRAGVTNLFGTASFFMGHESYEGLPVCYTLLK